MDPQLQVWSRQFPDWIWNTGVIAAAVILGLLIKLLVTSVLHYYKNRNDYSLFKSIITHLGRPLNFFVPLLVLSAMLPLSKFDPAILNTLERLDGILLTIAFASLLVNTFGIFEDHIYHQYDLSKADNLKERKIRTQLIFVRKVVIILVALVTISIILLSFSSVRKIGAGLLTGVGIGSIIIGFAAQKSLGNLLAGFQIAFTQPIRIDDVLVVEGEWGRIEDITLTYVVLNIWDQRRLILPITYFIEKPFQNWTRTTSEILGTVFIYVDHSFPVDDLRGELTRLLNASELWDKRVGLLQVTDAKERTIELRALVSAGNSSQAFDLRCYIRENLLKYINGHMPEHLPLIRLKNEENK